MTDTLTLDALDEPDAAVLEIVGRVVAMLRETAAIPSIAQLRGDQALRLMADKIDAALLRTLAEAADA